MALGFRLFWHKLNFLKKIVSGMRFRIYFLAAHYPFGQVCRVFDQGHKI
jgi:hypothetical protein